MARFCCVLARVAASAIITCISTSSDLIRTTPRILPFENYDAIDLVSGISSTGGSLGRAVAASRAYSQPGNGRRRLQLLPQGMRKAQMRSHGLAR